MQFDAKVQAIWAWMTNLAAFGEFCLFFVPLVPLLEGLFSSEHRGFLLWLHMSPPIRKGKPTFWVFRGNANTLYCERFRRSLFSLHQLLNLFTSDFGITLSSRGRVSPSRSSKRTPETSHVGGTAQQDFRRIRGTNLQFCSSHKFFITIYFWAFS